MPVINKIPRISTTTNLSNIVVPVSELVGDLAISKSARASDFFGIGYIGSRGDDYLIIGYTGSVGTGNPGPGYTGSEGTAGSIGGTGNAGYYGSFGYTGSQGDAGVRGYTGSGGTGTQSYTSSTVDGAVAYWIGTNTDVLFGAENILVTSDGNNLNIGGRSFGIGSGLDPGYDPSIAIGIDILSNTQSSHRGVIGIGERIMNYDNNGTTGTSYNAIAIGTDLMIGESTNNENNIAIGGRIMFYNTGSSHNIAIGKNIFTANLFNGEHNIAIGEYCHSYGSESSNHNISLGYYPLHYNLYGNTNVSILNSALGYGDAPYQNIAIGYAAAIYTNGPGPIVPEPVDYPGGGTNNIAFGNYALEYSEYGDNHIAFGNQALDTSEAIPNVGTDFDLGNPTYPNIGFGAYSLYLLNNTSLSNIGIGTLAGSYQQVTNSYNMGNDNVYIGHGTKAGSTGTNFEIVIGNRSTGKGSSTTYIAGSLGVYNEQNVSSWQTVSDQRIKKNIVDNNLGLDVVKNIQVKSFNYKTNEEISINNYGGLLVERFDTDKTITGVIAQDVQPVLPEAVLENSSGLLTVNTDPIFWAMLNSIKELENKISSLKLIVNSQTQEIP